MIQILLYLPSLNPGISRFSKGPMFSLLEQWPVVSARMALRYWGILLSDPFGDVAKKHRRMHVHSHIAMMSSCSFPFLSYFFPSAL